MEISVVLTITTTHEEKMMLNQPTIDRLRTLKLTGMAEALTEQL